MESSLIIYNTLSRTKEKFQPLNPPFVGMYVCGPTVYGDPHLGHARPAITFDLVFRYLQHLGYRVRYVRNITDVGHLEDDEDEGEDKIAKKARLEQLEPMEVAQYYSDRYFRLMDELNVKRPSIEPRASGHIPEQIEMIRKIIEAGYAYEVNGSVYFDVLKYNEKFNYGKLSRRILEDLISNTRKLEGQEEKRNSVDFALWKKAQPEHIMHWSSPWSDGFPGWHLECSAMATKYLGIHFDIHGGGMDLMFPHHESEIAQSRIANGTDSVKYWMHNNMITINGQKMGKSLGNFITLEEFFTGKHPGLTQKYTSMTIRFFILQAHYTSTLDFSNEALQAAEAGYKRLTTSLLMLNEIVFDENKNVEFDEREDNFLSNFEHFCHQAMNNDFNSPILISNMFGMFDRILAYRAGMFDVERVKKETFFNFRRNFNTFYSDVLGLKVEEGIKKKELEILNDKLIRFIINLRDNARINKDFLTADQIRDALQNLNITVKDTKEGPVWLID